MIVNVCILLRCCEAFCAIMKDAKGSIVRGGSMEAKTALLDHMRHVMRLKHRSLRIEDAYVSWVKRFILFHQKRHPSDMGAAAIRTFLTHLAVQGKVAASTQNDAFNALLFLYRHVLRHLQLGRRTARKKKTMGYPPARNAPFANIVRLRREYETAGDAVTAIDAKKKE